MTRSIKCDNGDAYDRPMGDDREVVSVCCDYDLNDSK